MCETFGKDYVALAKHKTTGKYVIFVIRDGIAFERGTPDQEFTIAEFLHRYTIESRENLDIADKENLI